MQTHPHYRWDGSTPDDVLVGATVIIGPRYCSDRRTLIHGEYTGMIGRVSHIASDGACLVELPGGDVWFHGSRLSTNIGATR